MNILTKISVVVLVVAVLFASAVFITYPRVTENWKQQYENMKGAKAVAETEAANQMMLASLAIAQRQADLEKAKAEKQALIDENGKLKVELADAKTANTSLTNSIAGIQTQMADVNNGLTTERGARKALEESLKAANAKLGELQRDLILAQDQIRQKEAANTQQEGQIRILRTEIASLKEQIDKQLLTIETLSKGGAAASTGNTPAPTPVAAQKITGKVTAVQGEIVSINVGSAKGVKKDMVLMIHRDGKLVGNLRISEVDVEQSAGVVEDKLLNPQQGDKVLSD